MSSEVAQRQQQCPGFTGKRFATNELIHHQKRVGTRGMMRRRRVRRKMKRYSVAEQGQSKGRTAQKETLHINITALAFPHSLACSCVLNVD